MATKSPLLSPAEVATLRSEFAWSLASDSGKLKICHLVQKYVRSLDSGFVIRMGEEGDGSPIITIRSFNHDWIRVWAHGVLQALSRTQRLKVVWRHAAAIADDINLKILAGEAPYSDNGCAGPKCTALRHYCQNCGRSTPCALLKTSSLGLSECEPCVVRGWDADGGKVQDCLLGNLGYHVRTEIKEKAAAMDAPQDQVDSQIRMCRESLKTLHTKVDRGLVLTFNVYTGKWMQPYPNGDRPLATGSSVECIWPLATINTGSIANHVPGNLCFTYLCLNYGKRMELPILLHFLGRFSRGRYRLLQDDTGFCRS